MSWRRMLADRPRVASTLRSLCSSTRRDADALLEVQDELVRALVSHAYRHVPRYRRLFDTCGIEPEDIRGSRDIGRIPITSRRDLQAADPEELVARQFAPKELDAFRTSGSSGSPLTIRRTRLERKLLQMFRIRALRHFGVGVTDRIARLGLPPDSSSHAEVLNRLGLGMYRYREVDARTDPRAAIQQLREIDPDVVTGYPGALARLAAELTLKDRSRIHPRMVILGGEVVSARLRRQVQKGFRALVREWYGSYECNLIAWECPETDRLHVSDDSVIVEVATDDGRAAESGERGELLVTSLHSYAMPFIRYRLGDVAIRGECPCPCGLPFSTLTLVQGRTLDFFRLSDGRSVHPYEVTNENIKPESWILQYQLVQEKLDSFRLRIVPSHPPPRGKLNELRTAVREVLGPDVRVVIDLVGEIESDPGGKFRQAVSLVDSSEVARAGGR